MLHRVSTIMILFWCLVILILWRKIIIVGLILIIWKIRDIRVEIIVLLVEAVLVDVKRLLFVLMVGNIKS